MKLEERKNFGKMIIGMQRRGFLGGVHSASLGSREKRGLIGLAIIVGPAMPLGTHFTSMDPAPLTT